MSTPEPEHDAERPTRRPNPSRSSRSRSRSRPIGVPAALPDRPIQTVGRRKEAIVRVRMLPGTGHFRLNGKTLEQYFPNKLHQQLIREPLVTVEKTERFDIFANLQGGGTSGQAGALRLAIARALIEADSEDRPAAEEGRLPDPRPAGHRAQEVRPEEGPQGAPVQQALIPRYRGLSDVCSARTAFAVWPTASS